MHPPERVVAGGGTQQRMPLPDLDGRGGIAAAAQQRIFCVEQTGRLVGTLDILPEPIKIRRLVAVEGALGNAGKGLTGFLDAGEQARQAARQHVARTDRAHAVIKGIELHPHLGRDQGPQRPRVLARIGDRAQDRGRIVGVGEIERQDAFGARRPVLFVEALLIGVQLNDREPALGGAAAARESLVDIEDARQVFGALDKARQPEDALGVASEERAATQDPAPAPRYLSTRLPARS